MKIFIVTAGEFVMKATTSLDDAKEYCEQTGGRYDGACGHRFTVDGFLTARLVHQYLAERSGRWNMSQYVITEIDLEA